MALFYFGINITDNKGT